MLGMPGLRSGKISRPEEQTNIFNKVINDIFIIRDRAGDAKSLGFWSQYDFPELPFILKPLRPRLRQTLQGAYFTSAFEVF